jgi:hypothetical protein
VDITEPFLRTLAGKPVTHAWRGAGSAIFLELAQLTDNKRRDGEPAQPTGDLSLMLEWSWRIERPRSILVGSFSSERKWPTALKRLIGGHVVGVEFVGRLPEIVVSLSNGLRVASFMTAEGQPAWSVIARHPKLGSLYVRNGCLTVETA